MLICGKIGRIVGAELAERDALAHILPIVVHDPRAVEALPTRGNGHVHGVVSEMEINVPSW